ncbi:MAG: FAD binding domain-containing protein [Myxococcota bacterium]
MLRLPRFEVLEPTSIDEALTLLGRYGDKARIMAGGTDLLPNMKHEIETPEVVIGLWKIAALRQQRETEGALHLGPLCTLDEIASNARVQHLFPSLAEAAGQVAGPQLRRMGTLGGNVCLDTRCVYINQTHFWRQSLGYCLKKDGTVCHVVAGGRRCVAAASNDTAPVLMTLGARLELRKEGESRSLAIDDFYVGNGQFNQDRARDELLTEIVIPKPKGHTVSAYAKLRTRAAIDFPELGVAVLAELSPEQKIQRLDVVLTALGARPVHVPKLEAFAGRALDEATIAEIAAAAFDRGKPLTNIATDPEYRREMVPVFVRRAFGAALNRKPTDAIRVVG